MKISNSAEIPRFLNFQFFSFCHDTTHSYPRIPLGIVKKNATSNCQWVKKAKDPKVSACQTFISSPTEKEEGDDEITANYIYDRTKKTSIFDFHFPDIDRSCAAPVKFEDPAVFPKLSDESETVVEKKWWVDKEALTKTQNEAKIEKTPKPAEAAVALENHEHQEIDAIHAESLSNTKKPDDAPQMARVKDMFLKFYPEIVVDASLECATKMLKISEINCIKINVFYSRYQFYFEEISTSHSYFMHCMKEFYELAGNDLKVQKEEHFMQGMLVAIKAGEWWLRAKILSVDPSNQDQVKCLFVDCGIECNVNKSNIEYLIKAFICHPINCFKGSSKINPGDLTGTNEAMNRRAFDAVAGKKLMIRINKYDPVKNVYEIETA